MQIVPIPLPDPIIPRSAYHAAQMELEGKGFLKAIGLSIQFIDAKTQSVSASWRYADNREARLQLDFFKKSAQDHKTNCTYLRLIKGGKA